MEKKEEPEAHSPTKHISGKFEGGETTSTWKKPEDKASDETVIKECLNYIAHRIKKHPESFASRNLSKWEERIDEMRLGKKDELPKKIPITKESMDNFLKGMQRVGDIRREERKELIIYLNNL